MRTIIFTEAGSQIGLGHLIRCISIANELKQNKVGCFFVLNSDYNVDVYLKGFNFIYSDWIKELPKLSQRKFSLAIIDSYIAGIKTYEDIKKITDKCLYFDDFNRLNYPKGLILNPVGNINDYPKRSHSDLLVGYRYQIFRKEFNKPYNFKLNENITNITITLGGSIQTNFFFKTVKILKQLDCKINIISSDPELDRLLANSPNIFFHKNLSASEVIKLFSNSDFVITAGGQTLLELICLKIPAIVIKNADNQSKNIENLLRLNCINYAGSSSNSDIFINISQCIEYFRILDNRKKIINNCKKILDAKGTQRVVTRAMKFALDT